MTQIEIESFLNFTSSGDVTENIMVSLHRIKCADTGAVGKKDVKGEMRERSRKKGDIHEREGERRRKKEKEIQNYQRTKGE